MVTGWRDHNRAPTEVLKTHFSLAIRISKNPAIFDFEKLEWMNGVYIRNRWSPPPSQLVCLPWLEEAGLASAKRSSLPGTSGS
jgi:glutamyl/glutaminyl-tRNA synthetase